MLQRISKPHIVDFLRQADRNKWILPRIRYASIRSKPELIEDLQKIFTFRLDGSCITFLTKARAHVNCNFPLLWYDLEARQYFVNHVASDFPRESRRTPQFSLKRGPVTLRFPLCNDTDAGNAVKFPSLDMSTLEVVTT